jgi:DNA-binding CsgD family transcriptional regulator
MTSGRPLTPEQKATIERRMNANAWPMVVARELDISRHAVTNHMKRIKEGT